MTATLAAAPAVNVLEMTTGDGATRELRAHQDFYPHRFSATGVATAPVVFAGFGISAPQLGHDDYGGDVKGAIVLALDHEPGERDPNSPFDGVVTSEPSTPWRKALAAQEKGAVGVLFVADVHNHPGAANFEAAARTYWPEKPPRILNYTLAAWADRIRIPVAQISPAAAASLVAGSDRTLDDLARAAETPRGFAPVPLPGARVMLRTAVDRHIVPDRNVVALLEGQRCAAEERVGDRVRALRSQRRGRRADLQRRRRQRLGHRRADRDRRGLRAGREGRPCGRSARSCSRPGTPRSAACSARGRTPSSRWRRSNTIAAVLNMDMIGRNEESAGRRRRALQRPRCADRGIEQQRA